MRVAAGSEVVRLVRGRTRVVPFLFLDELGEPMADLDDYTITMTLYGPHSRLPAQNFWEGQSLSLSPCFTGLTISPRSPQSGSDLGYADWDPLDDGSGYGDGTYATTGTIEQLTPGFYMVQFVYAISTREDRVPEEPGDLWIRVFPRLDSNS